MAVTYVHQDQQKVEMFRKEKPVSKRLIVLSPPALPFEQNWVLWAVVRIIANSQWKKCKCVPHTNVHPLGSTVIKCLMPALEKLQGFLWWISTNSFNPFKWTPRLPDLTWSVFDPHFIALAPWQPANSSLLRKVCSLLSASEPLPADNTAQDWRAGVDV